MTERSRIPNLTNFVAQIPAVSSHSVDEENTSVQIECEQVTAVAEQSETNNFVVYILMWLIYLPKSIGKDPVSRDILSPKRLSGGMDELAGIEYQP